MHGHSSRREPYLLEEVRQSGGTPSTVCDGRQGIPTRIHCVTCICEENATHIIQEVPSNADACAQTEGDINGVVEQIGGAHEACVKIQEVLHILQTQHVDGARNTSPPQRDTGSSSTSAVHTPESGHPSPHNSFTALISVQDGRWAASAVHPILAVAPYTVDEITPRHSPISDTIWDSSDAHVVQVNDIHYIFME
jgi:hypothetical protein